MQSLDGFTIKLIQKFQKSNSKPYHYIPQVLEIKSLVLFKDGSGGFPTVIGGIQELALIALKWLIE